MKPLDFIIESKCHGKLQICAAFLQNKQKIKSEAFLASHASKLEYLQPKLKLGDSYLSVAFCKAGTYTR